MIYRITGLALAIVLLGATGLRAAENDAKQSPEKKASQQKKAAEESSEKKAPEKKASVAETAEDKASASKTVSKKKVKKEVDVPKTAVALLRPTEGNRAIGLVLFEEKGDKVHITGQVVGLSPGKHGFHIHEYGDPRSSDATSAGGHFAPYGKEHGSPEADEHHYGDFGNIVADDRGKAEIDMEIDWVKLHFILGRALIVHEGEDNFEQPTGHAGPRIAWGIIGIANPELGDESQ